MDNTKGGYVIIDISKLVLAETESATAITEASVLKQLLSLSLYGLKPEVKLKPIYLRALDENGLETVVLCELDRSMASLRIRAEILEHSLEIIVVYDVDSDTQEVTIDTATYEYIDNSEVILSLLSDKDLKVKTVEQSEANYDADISTFPNLGGSGVGELIYGKVQQINGELHIIFIGKITNNTGSAISGYSTGSIGVTLPEGIASKIIDMNGKSVHESSNGVRISGTYAYASKNNGADVSSLLGNTVFILLNTTTENALQILFERSSAITINDGEVLYFEGRVSLDLL